MPAGNGVSGINGDLLIGSAQVKEVRKWSFNPKQDTKTYASNITAGFNKSIRATKSGTGTIDGVWDPWNPITAVLDIGSEVTLKAQTYSGQFWLIPCVIDSMTFEVNIETGDVESWTANFSTQGAWTNPAALAVTTTTTTTTAAFLPGGMETAGDLEDEGGGGEEQEPQGARPVQSNVAKAGGTKQAAHGGGGISEKEKVEIATMVAQMLQGMLGQQSPQAQTAPQHQAA